MAQRSDDAATQYPVPSTGPAYVGRRRARPVETDAPAPVAPAAPAAPSYVGRRRAAVPPVVEAPLVTPYVGRRAARPAPAPAHEPVVASESRVGPVLTTDPLVAAAVPAVDPVAPVEEAAPAAETAPIPVQVPVQAPAVAVSRVADETAAVPVVPLLDETVEIGAVAASPTVAPVVSSVGRRRAVRHAGSRGPLFRALPSVPVLVGLAAMSITVVGVVTSADPEPAAADHARYNAASALSGTTTGATVDGLRGTVSRDSDRDALDDATGSELVEEADAQAEQLNAALGELAKEAEEQSNKIELNRWQLPLAGYHLTATFGEYGLWATYHTGLDFAAPSGTPLVAVANGVITSTGYDGAYGNKTVLTLEDGTEIWYCHQTDIGVSVGDVVNAGDAMGTVGATGNVTGPHLHLEVRPGGGDPVDPDAALREHGVTP